MHVVGPQLGLTQPGMTVVCGDSHTSTHGAFGALAFGIGTSEVEHVLATQTLPLKPFKTMAITVEGELPDGVTAKDIILAVIAKIGTGGGQGYVLEYRGEAIRALSMEARMTVCNMSIEAGARAGHDRARRDHLRLPQGPCRTRPRAPTGTPPSSTGAPAQRRRRRVRRGGRARRRRARRRSSRGAPTPARACRCPARARPRARSPTRTTAPRAERALEYMGLTPGTPLRDDRGRHGLHRLVHQRPHRGPARRRRGRSRAAQVPTACAMLVVPGSARVRLQAEAEGLDKVFTRLRCRVAQRRLLDVPGHEPRPARAGGAQRLDVEPQLRGPAGQGRPHPPGLAARRRRDRRPRDAVVAATSARRSTPTQPATTSDGLKHGLDRHGEVHDPHRRRRAAAPQQRRHRPDHPRRLPQAGHPHRLRGRRCSPPGAATPSSCSTSPPTRPARCSSPAPTSAPAPRASTPSGR